MVHELHVSRVQISIIAVWGRHSKSDVLLFLKVKPPMSQLVPTWPITLHAVASASFHLRSSPSLHLLSLSLILHLSTPIYLSSLPPPPSLPLYLSRPRSDHNSSSLNRVVPLLLSPLIPLLLLAILAISRLIHTTTTTTPPPSRFFFSPLLYNTILVHFTRLLLWIYSRVFVSTSHRGHFAASLVLSRPVSACLVCVCVFYTPGYATHYSNYHPSLASITPGLSGILSPISARALCWGLLVRFRSRAKASPLHPLEKESINRRLRL